MESNESSSLLQAMEYTAHTKRSMTSGIALKPNGAGAQKLDATKIERMMTSCLVLGELATAKKTK